MCADFVLLADGAASNEVIDEDGKSRPPKIMFHDGLGTKTSEVARERRRVDGVKKRGASGWWYIHTALVVEASIVESPVGQGGAWKEGHFVRQVLNSTKDKRVR